LIFWIAVVLYVLSILFFAKFLKTVDPKSGKVLKNREIVLLMILFVIFLSSQMLAIYEAFKYFGID